jgi:hypothetical protein
MFVFEEMNKQDGQGTNFDKSLYLTLISLFHREDKEIAH